MSDSEGRRRVEAISAHQHHGGRDLSLGHWSAPVTPTFSNGFSFEDDHDHHHAKKSVLAKVKEKAKKWRHLLAKKKHGHDDNNLTPPWGVSLDEEDEEQDTEYHGAPMYESETAPEAYREGTSQHRPAARSPGALEKSTVVVQPDENRKKGSEMKQGNTMRRSPPHNVPTHQSPVGETGNNNNNNNKTLTETVTEMLAPAYTMVSGASQMMASKMQSPGTGYELGAKQVWDKGISVKEYLMHKLEPGEEDRALCQVITEAVSPRNAAGGEAQGEVGGGIMDKVKEAVSSLLLAREEHQETQVVPAAAAAAAANPTSAHERPIPVSTSPHAREAPAPISTNLRAAPGGSPIPLSTNIRASEPSVPVSTKNLRAQEVEESSPTPVSMNPPPPPPRTEEVETGGRRLQAYTN